MHLQGTRRSHPRARWALLLGALWATLAVLAPGHARAAEPGAGPWRQGQQTSGGWQVTAVTEHPEFVRYTLRRGETETGVEIVAYQGPAGPFSGERHRIQPAPKAEIDEATLAVLAEDLRAWERAPGAARAKLATRGTAEAQASFDAASLALLLLNLLGVGLALGLGVSALRSRPELVPWVLVAVAATAGAWVWLFALHSPRDIPLSWITVLHEGPTAQNIEVLYGRNRHTGPNHHFLVWLLADTARFGLRDLVRMNLWLSCVQTALLLVLARAILRHILPAAVLVSFFALSPAARYAAGSELATPLTSVYLLLGAVTMAALPRPGDASRPRRGAALGALAALTLLLGLTRTETAGFGLLALPWWLARARWGEQRLAEVGATLWTRCRALRWWQGALGLLGLAATVPLMWVDGRVGWLLAGLHPLNPSIFSAPLLLVALLPLGAVALVLLGAVQAARRWRHWGALIVAVLVLYRVYYSASHGVFYEMLRYAATLLPAFALLATLGWSELEQIARWRRWPPRWRHAAMAALAVLMLVPTMPSASALLWDTRPGALPTVGMLDTDQQAEVRAMLGAIEAHPECVLATRVTAETERVYAQTRYGWRLFGGPLPAPLSFSEEQAAVGDLAGLVPDNPCVLFFHSLDCHLLQGRDCHDVIAGRPRVGGERRPSKPYNDAHEYGAVRAQLDLGLYALRQAPAQR